MPAPPGLSDERHLSMFIRSAFEWVDALPSSVALRGIAEPVPDPADGPRRQHVPVRGLIAFWDMRLVGLTLKKCRCRTSPARLFPWALTGYAINLITGGLLLYSQPMRYYGNFYFWAKMLLMVVAGINMFWFTTHLQSVQAGDQGRDIRSTPGSPALCPWCCGRPSS